MKYMNLTPHAIVMNDGRVFQPSGHVARVAVSHSDILNDCCDAVYGDVTGLPSDVADDVTFIVSAMVLSAVKGDRRFVSPATGHKDCIRDDKGHIVSVPCFVRAYQSI